MKKKHILLAVIGGLVLVIILLSQIYKWARKDFLGDAIVSYSPVIEYLLLFNQKVTSNYVPTGTYYNNGRNPFMTMTFNNGTREFRDDYSLVVTKYNIPNLNVKFENVIDSITLLEDVKYNRIVDNFTYAYRADAPQSADSLYLKISGDTKVYCQDSFCIYSFDVKSLTLSLKENVAPDIIWVKSGALDNEPAAVQVAIIKKNNALYFVGLCITNKTQVLEKGFMESLLAEDIVR